MSDAVTAWGFHIGAVTERIDGALILFWAFALFFGVLVWYLRAQDKLEGYPMKDPTRSARSGDPVGFPPPPPPKTYTLLKGGTATMPHRDSPPEVKARKLHPFPGSALVPTGNPMLDGIGPSAFCLREDEPLLMNGHDVQVMPLREAGAEGWDVQGGDADPRGLPVLGRDGKVAGHVCDLWVDRSVKILRYLEIELNEGSTRLMPIFFASVSPKLRRVKTRSIYAAQFALVPGLKNPNRVTAREEDRICAYFAGGKLFATAVRDGAFFGRTYA